MSEPSPAAKSGSMRISIAAQLDPIWRHGRIGEGGTGDVKLFAEQMTAYLAQNLEGFADPRGGDVYVAVSVRQDGETAAHEYRSGHFVKEAAGAGGVSSSSAATGEEEP